jgi:Ca-activated chloride channel family protein
MRNALKRILSAVTIGFCAFAGASHGAGLLVPSNGSSADGLQIKSHEVAVTIEDGYAITEVNQVFHNPQANDLEAVYRFPVPDKAAVSEFTVWIDGQPVIGEVLEKAQARQAYQQEKAAGREAGLAEKNKHYNFEVSVTPVRAGQDTRTRLIYMQAVDIDTGIGRYVYPLENGGTDDAANAFWKEDAQVHEKFSFDLTLRSAYAVSGLRLPAHQNANITQTDAQQWQVSMANNVAVNALQTPVDNIEDQQNAVAISEDGSTLPRSPLIPGLAGSLETDVVVYWKFSPDTPASVDLVTYKAPDKSKGTFMLTLTPGNDLAPITEGRDWAFVLDMSGSMQGKYATLVDGVNRALKQLKPQDRFRIIRFNDQASELTPSWIPANNAEVAHWGSVLASSQVSGGTNLYAGAEKGLKALDADRTSVIVLVTDGEANVGVTEKKAFLKLMEKRDVRLFTAVMGNGANRPLLEAMTEVSNGFAVSVSNSDDVVGKILEFTSKATHSAMHDIELSISGVKTTDLTPEVTNTLYRGEQLTVFGHYHGSGPANVTLSAKISGQKKQYKTSFNFPDVDQRNPELERLWAFAKIQDMQKMIDYLGDDSEYKAAIVDTAVQHSIVTDHTSMVVMREESFAANNISRNNQQRRQREVAAAQQRAAQPVNNTRVDQSTPAFQGSRSGYGGGAIGLELLMLLGFVLAPLFLRARHRRT